MPNDDEPRVVYSRRHFIKTVIAGTALGAAGGCPVPHTSNAAGDAGAAAADAGAATAPVKPHVATALNGEIFAKCHAVRDGATLPSVEPTETAEIVVVGGGPSGLFAAHRFRDRDVILLEKEPETGGNCRADEWNGVKMSTGGAFYTQSETTLIDLLAEIDAKGTPVVGPDSLIAGGVVAKDFFRDGAKDLPFAQNVRDDFKKSRDDMLKLYKTKKPAELDAITFAELLKPYAPELRKFWDQFGQSNWGGTTENTSGFVGAEAYTWAGGAEDPRFTYPGGMSGAAKKLAERVKQKLGARMRVNAAAYRVDVEGAGKKATAIVRWWDGDVPKAIRAKAVIVAAPKYFAKFLVPSLPQAHVAEMRAIRYLPMLLLNVCLNEPGPEPAYDNFFLDTPFTDFIPADWILYAGKGPPTRKTALTVYHPLPETMRATLLVDQNVADLADTAVDHIERHFPGTRAKIAEVRAFRRGHAMYMSTPGRLALAEKARAPEPPVFFANTDCGTMSTFYDGIESGARATADARKHLGLPAKKGG